MTVYQYRWIALEVEDQGTQEWTHKAGQKDLRCEQAVLVAEEGPLVHCPLSHIGVISCDQLQQRYNGAERNRKRQLRCCAAKAPCDFWTQANSGLQTCSSKTQGQSKSRFWLPLPKMWGQKCRERNDNHTCDILIAGQQLGKLGFTFSRGRCLKGETMAGSLCEAW